MPLCRERPKSNHHGPNRPGDDGESEHRSPPNARRHESLEKHLHAPSFHGRLQLDLDTPDGRRCRAYSDRNARARRSAHFSHTLFPSLARWVPPGMLCVRILDNVSSSHENRHAQHAAQNFSPQSGKNLLKFLQVLTPQGGRRSYRSVNSTSSNRHASSTALLRSNTCSIRSDVMTKLLARRFVLLFIVMLMSAVTSTRADGPVRLAPGLSPADNPLKGLVPYASSKRARFRTAWSSRISPSPT